MTRTLLEAGLGAMRALEMAGDTVLAAHFERDDVVRAGAVHGARLATILEAGRRGIVTLIGGVEALLEPLPAVAEGSVLRVEVVREALPEAGRPRLAKVRAVPGGATAVAVLAPGPDLAARLGATPLPPGPGADALEAAGWGETLALAQSGHLPFAGGMLTISLTPAMTVIDVDGAGDPARLALAAAPAVAAALRLFGIGGGIVVDFPSLGGRAARAGLDAALDAALVAQGLAPFERTAVNGFGLVQIVRPRPRANLMEQVRAPGFGALELLRRAGRGSPGRRTLVAHPATIGWLERRADLIAALARCQGGAVRLVSDARMAMWGGDVVLG